MKFINIALIAALPLAVSGCSGKNEPSEKNFTPLINQIFAQDNLACLSSDTFPHDVTAAELNGTAPVPEIGKELEALKNAGLLVATPVTAQQSDLPGAARRYKLSDTGLKYFHPDAFDKPESRHGKLCYGHLSLGKVTRWDKPMKLGDYEGTIVYYTYRIDDLADWAKRGDVQAASPNLRQTVMGMGVAESRWGMTLTSGGWKANS